MNTRGLTLREISPDLADILDTAKRHDADPSGIESFTTEWLISEVMRDDPSLTREQALAHIRQANAEAEAGGL